MEEPVTQRRIDGPTPAGGDYAVAYYYDDLHDATDEEHARFVHIVEYTKNGERITETYATLK